jgi:hypothetical protein
MPYVGFQGVTITLAEYNAATSSIWFNPYRFGDGRGNLDPAANIAVLRGARYDNNGPLFFSDMKITDKAMRDLAMYLGFGTDVNAYNAALLLEGNRIFLRGPKIPVTDNCGDESEDQTQAPIPSIPATSSYPFPVIVQGGLTEQLSDKPAGQSEGTIGPPVVSPPTIFDTGYVYNGQVTLGGGLQDNFGNLGGDLNGDNKKKKRKTRKVE